MFTKCFRCTKDLKQSSFDLFYDDKIINDVDIELSMRLKWQKIIDYFKFEYDYETKISRIVSDLQNEICHTTSSESRYNVHNIAMTMKLIESLMTKNIFKSSKITIETSYHVQNIKYRAIITTAKKPRFE